MQIQGYCTFAGLASTRFAFDLGVGPLVSYENLLAMTLPDTQYTSRTSPISNLVILLIPIHGKWRLTEKLGKFQPYRTLLGGEAETHPRHVRR